MNTYVVTFFRFDKTITAEGPGETEYFVCQADDKDHAEEQCFNAFEYLADISVCDIYIAAAVVGLRPLTEPPMKRDYIVLFEDDPSITGEGLSFVCKAEGEVEAEAMCVSYYAQQGRTIKLIGLNWADAMVGFGE